MSSLNLLPIHELLKLKQLPQYYTEPIVYYITRFGTTLNPPKMYRHKVEAYVLCKDSVCVGLHFIKDDVYFNGDVEKLPEIIDSLLKDGEPTIHEMQALARFFLIDEEAIEDIMYQKYIEKLVRGKRVAVVRNMAYIVENSKITPIGVFTREEIRRFGGRLVKDPVYTITNIIREVANPKFYVYGRGEILFCNNKVMKCKCFPVEDIIDLITRQLKIEERKVKKWVKKRSIYLIWVDGWKYESECLPRRVPEKEGEEERAEATATEYITR